MCRRAAVRPRRRGKPATPAGSTVDDTRRISEKRCSANGSIESTLARGGMVLKDLGVSDTDVSELLSGLRDDDYALIRAAYGKG
jgi:hypothetical protein